MRGVAEDRILKFSIGILIVMAGGLITGTTFIVTLSNASEEHRRAIEELRTHQAVTDSWAADLAVIKQRLDSIDKKLDK